VSPWRGSHPWLYASLNHDKVLLYLLQSQLQSQSQTQCSAVFYANNYCCRILRPSVLEQRWLLLSGRGRHRRQDTSGGSRILGNVVRGRLQERLLLLLCQVLLRIYREQLLVERREYDVRVLQLELAQRFHVQDGNVARKL